MRYGDVKDRFVWYLTYSLQGNEATASEIYTDDAVVEFPQSGERFRGKEHFIPWRSDYPAATVEFEVRAIRGNGDTWTAEGRIRYSRDICVSWSRSLRLGRTRSSPALSLMGVRRLSSWRRSMLAGI